MLVGRVIQVGVTTIVLAVSKKAAMTAEQLEAIRSVVSRATVLVVPCATRPARVRARASGCAVVQAPGATVVCSEEEAPMGTAGPLALARAHLEGSDPFFVFNSAVACEYPLADLLAFHKRHGREGTIMV